MPQSGTLVSTAMTVARQQVVNSLLTLQDSLDHSFVAWLRDFLDWSLGLCVEVHGLCLCEELRLVQVDKVCATVVAKEGQDVSAVDILSERRTDAIGDLGR